MDPDPVTASFVRYRDRGDVEALGAVFDALAPRLLAIALHACGNAADAEDALQATFVVAMRKASAFDASARAGVGGWLAGLLGGEAKNVARREARRRGVPLDDVGSASAAASVAASVRGAAVGADGDPGAAVERGELVARLRGHVEALPDEQRQALLLQLEHGLQPAEIAEVLRVPPGTVRMRIHRGLAALRATLPVGLGALLAASLPARGIAAVRAVVLHEATTLAAPAVAAAPSAMAAAAGAGSAIRGAGVLIGGIVMKKLVVAFAAAILVLALWWAVPGLVPGSTPLPPAPAVAPVVAVAPGDAAPTGDAARIAASAPVEARVGGVLRIRVLGHVQQRQGNAMVADAVAGSGEPVAGAIVSAWTGAPRADAALAVARGGRTGADGVLELCDLPAGPWRIDVADGTRFGSASTGATVAPSERAEVEVHVVLRGVVRGRVVDARGAAVPDAELWAGNRIDEASTGERELRCAGRTDARGAFACAVLVSEQLLGARKDGYAASWCHVLDQPGDGDVVLELADEPATVIARMLRADGRPPQRTSFVLEFRETGTRRAPDGSLRAPPLGWRGTEEDPGRFVVRGVPPGFVTGRASAPGISASAVARVVAGGVHELATFELTALGEVTGHVRGEDGTPRAGLGVRIVHDGAKAPRGRLSDEGGAFRIGGLEPGPATVAVVRGRRTLHEQRIVLRDGEVVALEIVVAEPPAVRGRVRGPNGDGLGGWLVAASHADGPCEVQAGFDGAFVLHGVPPGPLALTVRRRPGAADAVQQAFVVGAARDAVLDVVVPAEHLPSASVRGRAVDEQGRPIACWAELANGNPAPPGPGEPEFELAGLDAGRCTVELHAEDRVTRRERLDLVHGERRDLGDVLLPRAAALRVRFLRPDGTTWRGHLPRPRLDGLHGARAVPADLVVDADGDTIVVRRIPPGRYRVALGDDDELRVDAQEVDLRGGQTATLVMPTSLGRRCTFEFPDCAVWPFGEPVDVVGTGADGTVRFRRTISVPHADAGTPAFTEVLPFGDLEVIATHAGRTTHRLRTSIATSLASRTTFPVPPGN